MSRLAVSTDSINIHLSLWLYRLRMCQAHLESATVAGLLPHELLFCQETIADLLGACEDAATWIQDSSEFLEASPEAGVGEDRS